MNTDIAKVRLSCPQDAIAVVPHLLGFHPSPGSLAIIAFADRQNTGVLRYDIPPASHAAALNEHLIRCLASQCADEVILIGYGPAVQVTPALTSTREALDGLLTIREILRVTNGRWWSLMCENPACCLPEGSPCDIASTVPAAQFTVHGSAPLSSVGHPPPPARLDRHPHQRQPHRDRHVPAWAARPHQRRGHRRAASRP